jgi:ubiquinone/menaquinone biosynthesis C-methylase UbiE
MGLARSVRRAISDRLYAAGPARWYVPAYDRVAAEIVPRMGTVLDVGCGPGGFSCAAAGRSADVRVIGIDRSTRMVRIAIEAAGGIGNVSFHVMDAASMTLPDASVDVAVAIQSAHHWEDALPVLVGVARVLRSGGAFHVLEADAEARDVPIGWLDRPAPWPPDAWVLLQWRRFGMDGEEWSRLAAVARRSPLHVAGDDRLGFYRRLVLRRP